MLDQICKALSNYSHFPLQSTLKTTTKPTKYKKTTTTSLKYLIPHNCLSKLKHGTMRFRNATTISWLTSTRLVSSKKLCCIVPMSITAQLITVQAKHPIHQEISFFFFLLKKKIIMSIDFYNFILYFGLYIVYKMDTRLKKQNKNQ